MSLSNVLEEIKKVKPIAEENTLTGNRDTYQARAGRKRNAKEQYQNLLDQYTEELRLSSAFIVVLGSLKEEFSTLAQSDFGCFSADPEAFYKDLANRLPAELYQNKI